MVEQSDLPGVRLVPASSERAPFVHFDGTAAFGVSNGIVRIELMAATLVPDGDSARVDALIVAHLRCSPTAALLLRDAIDKALRMQALSSASPAH